ncbi:hypothetical protein Pve01_60520 [Planomonospora venezuelensis]|nr:hypothetical protein Pve01_60520 [Planomonospora venezuelensis]
MIYWSGRWDIGSRAAGRSPAGTGPRRIILESYAAGADAAPDAVTAARDRWSGAVRAVDGRIGTPSRPAAEDPAGD